MQYSPHVEIRLVRGEDVEAVVAHVRASLAEFGLEFGRGAETDDQLSALPGSYADHGGAFWVAGDVIGTCGVFPVAAGVYELRKMYLAPTSRGTGLGKRMLATAIAWVREQGGTQLVLDTTEAMSRAIAFYEANGFVRDDAQRRGSRCSRGYSLALR